MEAGRVWSLPLVPRTGYSDLQISSSNVGHRWEARGGKREAKRLPAFKRKMDSDPLLCMPSLPGTQLINYSQTFGVMARDGETALLPPLPLQPAQKISARCEMETG